MPNPEIQRHDLRELWIQSADGDNAPYIGMRGNLYWNGSAWVKWTGKVSAPWDDPIFVDGAVTAQPSTYAMQYDDTGSGGISYQGWALAGTATSAASWRIRKIVQTGNDFAITWADGNTTMDNVWNNRAALSYS